MLTISPACHAEAKALLAHSRSRVVRAMRDAAEHDLVIPEGKYKGSRFRSEVQPWSRLLLDEIDSGRWRRFAITGCVQSGKSLVGFVWPTMYHLFEVGEPVIVGVPNLDVIGRNKWENELRPAIAASRFAKYLPSEGAGSRGGFKSEIRFSNGVPLKFMSGAGGDAERSSYTARVVIATEVDKMDTAGLASREADPISQFEARTASYAEDARRLFLECTVSIPEGRIWQEYTNGSKSRIACPCPHCGEWVTPEREHLVGWQQTETVKQANRLAYFACPSCGEKITAAQRRTMNKRAKLVHQGEEIDRAGTIRGEPPETFTLGFRWNAFNNLFWTAGGVAVIEWQQRNSEDDESAEKALRQFYWVVPHEPPKFDVRALEFSKVRYRATKERITKGVVPTDCEYLSGGIDLGKRCGYWWALAFRPDTRPHLVDYGSFSVPSDTMAVERAIVAALEELRDETFSPGWQSMDGKAWTPGQVLVDAGYEPDAVYMFCNQKESGERFRAAIGRGESQHDKRYRSYRHPKKVTNEVKLIGDQYYVVWDAQRRSWRIEFNTDHWKAHLFERLQTRRGEPGSMEFYYSSDRNEHITLAKHLTAEHPFEEFIPGKGTVVKWRKRQHDNHYLDCGSMSMVAWHLLGGRLMRPATPESPAQATTRVGSVLTLPDGRPFLVTER